MYLLYIDFRFFFHEETDLVTEFLFKLNIGNEQLEYFRVKQSGNGIYTTT